MASDLPAFSELPVRVGAPAGSSWGLWGDEDRFGCLNLLSPAGVQAALGTVQDGTVFPLNLELELPDPPLFGRGAIRHEVRSRSGWSYDDHIEFWNTQSSSQWDGFRHVHHVRYGPYNGLDEQQHGIHHWAQRGLAGRVVLADVARWRAAQGRPIEHGRTDRVTGDDLLATLAAQGSVVQPGDLLLVHFGYLGWYRGLDADARRDHAENLGTVGLEASVRTAEVLWDLHIAAIGCDNPAVEVWPPPIYNLDPRPDRAELAERIETPEEAAQLFLHLVLLPLLGLPLGELWDLTALADACAKDGRYEAMFTSAPVNLAQGAASPPNALVLR